MRPIRSARRAALLSAAFVILSMLIVETPARAVVLGQVDTFEDGTTMGWRHGSPSAPLPPIHVSGGGPGGASDDYLSIRTDGSEAGSGSRLLALNTAQWLGDYLSAGVGSIRLDARNPNTEASLKVHLAFRGGGASTYITNGITLAPNTPWSSLAFDLSASNMVFASGDYNACFGGVTMVRILHSASTPTSDSGEVVRNAAGAPIAAQLHVDNVTAVPEPGAIGAVAVITVAVLRRVRSRR